LFHFICYILFFKHKIGLICDFFLKLFDFSLMIWFKFYYAFHTMLCVMQSIVHDFNSILIIFWLFDRKFHRNTRTLKNKEILIWCGVASNAFKSSSAAVLYLSTNLMQEFRLKVILFTNCFDCFKVKNKMLILILDFLKVKIT
jgi:hypothetical protein